MTISVALRAVKLSVAPRRTSGRLRPRGSRTLVDCRVTQHETAFSVSSPCHLIDRKPAPVLVANGLGLSRQLRGARETISSLRVWNGATTDLVTAFQIRWGVRFAF